MNMNMDPFFYASLLNMTSFQSNILGTQAEDAETHSDSEVELEPSL